MSPIAFLAVLLVTVACQKDATQLVVLVNTDYAVPAEMGLVRARISDVAGREISTSDFALVDVQDPADPARFVVPFSFGVLPVDDDASRRVVVDIDGVTAAGDLLVNRRAVTGFLSERTLLLPMFLTRSCEGVVCPEGQSCTEDGCVTNVVEPGSLREILPGEELLDSGVDGGDSGGIDTSMDAPDAPTDAPDTSVDAPDSPMDASTPLSCGTARCVCPAGYCDVACTAATQCRVVCQDLGCTVDAAGTSALDVQCDVGASCVIDAQMVSSVQITCRDSSSCDVDCRGTASCTVRCFGTMPACIVQCAGSADCQISICGTGAPMTCPGNIIVCGRPCP